MPAPAPARLLEVGALAARCRVRLVAADREGEGETRELVERLEATLQEVVAAAEELDMPAGVQEMKRSTSKG